MSTQEVGLSVYKDNDTEAAKEGGEQKAKTRATGWSKGPKQSLYTIQPPESNKTVLWEGSLSMIDQQRFTLHKQTFRDALCLLEACQISTSLLMWCPLHNDMTKIKIRDITCSPALNWGVAQCMWRLSHTSWPEPRIAFSLIDHVLKKSEVIFPHAHDSTQLDQQPHWLCGQWGADLYS